MKGNDSEDRPVRGVFEFGEVAWRRKGGSCKVVAARDKPLPLPFYLFGVFLEEAVLHGGKGEVNAQWVGRR